MNAYLTMIEGIRTINRKADRIASRYEHNQEWLDGLSHAWLDDDAEPMAEPVQVPQQLPTTTHDASEAIDPHAALMRALGMHLA
jgi:hypothetical protein